MINGEEGVAGGGCERKGRHARGMFFTAHTELLLPDLPLCQLISCCCVSTRRHLVWLFGAVPVRPLPAFRLGGGC